MSSISVGHGPHKQRSINVEVNLLTTWQSEQSVRIAQLRRQLTTLGLLVAVGGFTIPASFVAFRVSATKASVAHRRASQSSTELAKLKENETLAETTLNRAEMLETTRKRSEWLLRELAYVINAAKPGVTFTGLSLDFTPDAVSIKLSAESASSEIAADFIDQASRGKTVAKAGQTAVKRSNEVYDNGIRFDFQKQLRVTPQ